MQGPVAPVGAMARAPESAAGAAPRSPSSRDVLLSVAGLLLPVAAAILSVPLMLQGMGSDRFGTFSILLAALAYGVALDFGFASAVTYRIAAMLAGAGGAAGVRHLVHTALVAVLAFGAVLAAAVWSGAEHVVAWMGAVPGELQGEAVWSVRLLALSLPVSFAAALLAGVLSGYSAFTKVNAVRVVSGLVGALAPALVVTISPRLDTAFAILLLVRAAVFVTHWVQCRPFLLASAPAPVRASRTAVLLGLLSFGGWMMASNLVSPLIHHMDRFYLGAMRSAVEASQYAPPFELASKVGLIPAGVLPLLFPMLVASWVQRSAGRGDLANRLTAVTALACGVPAALLAALAPQVMQAWMGNRLPAESATVLQVLAAGVLMNCLAQVYYVQVQALGRTDLIAKLHLLELPAYALLLWVVLGRFGITGAAFAWTVRAMLDAAALCCFASSSIEARERRQAFALLVAAVGLASALVLLPLVSSLPVRLLVPGGLVLVAVAAQRRLRAAVAELFGRPGAAGS